MKRTDKKERMVNKIARIAGNAIVAGFLVICAYPLILAVTSGKDSDGAADLFGRQMRIVLSPSMEESEYTDVSGYDIKSIPVRSMVFIEQVPEDEQAARDWYAQLKIGDVLTFRYVYGRQVTITHRITGIEAKEGGYILRLQGDNHADETGAMVQTVDTADGDSPNYVIGRVTGQSVVLGNILYVVRQPVGMALIVIVPCSIIIIWEIVRVVSVLTAEKKQKRMQERREQEDEIDRLRRELQELKGGGGEIKTDQEDKSIRNEE